MSKLDLQYDIVNGNPGDATPVEANFNRIENHINTELIERDGSVAMRNPLLLPGNPLNPLEAAPKQYVDQIVPIGGVIMWVSPVAPVGGVWLLCDGVLYATADYPELFALAQYRYGGAGGSFGVPPLMNNGTFPRGSTTPGSTGGSADLVVPLHSHTINHQHGGTSTGNASNDHTHVTTDHLHTAGGLFANDNGQHWHQPSNGAGFVTNGAIVGGPPQGFISPAGIALGGDGYNVIGGTGDSGMHNHQVIGFSGGADRSLGTGGQSLTHSHSYQTPTFNGSSGNAGVSGVGQNLPPFTGMAFIIRAK